MPELADTLIPGMLTVEYEVRGRLLQNRVAIPSIIVGHARLTEVVRYVRYEADRIHRELAEACEGADLPWWNSRCTALVHTEDRALRGVFETEVRRQGWRGIRAA